MKQETIHGLFALLRKALHPEREEPKLRSLQLDWPALYRLAANQGVLALAWDGVERAVAAGDLVQEQLPDRMLKIKWALAVETIEKRHKRQLACVQRMDEALNEAREQVMLFKGVGLAQFYPVPHHRECGDIDIYPMGGHFETVNQTLVKAGGEMHYDSMKHVEVLLAGVMIENHRVFFSGPSTAQLRKSNRTLAQLVAGATPLHGHVAVLAPQPRFDQLFVMMHGAMHFRRGEMTLRQLLDWYVVMQQAHFQPDVELLQQHGMMRFAAAIHHLCEEWLGAPKVSWGQSATVVSDAALILQDMLALGVDVPKKGSPLQVVWRKAKRFWCRRWTYPITGMPFWAALLYSIYAHLRLPKTIFNPTKR